MSVPVTQARSLAFLLGLALAIRLFFLSVTPFDDRHTRFGVLGFNDELSHVNYVRWLAEHGSLPVQTRSVLDPGAFVHNDFEYYQPPLYYAAAVPFYTAFEAASPGSGGYGARLLSVICGVLTIAVAFRIGSVFGSRTGPACAILIAFLPTHAFFTGIATNDSLAWLIGSLFIHRILRGPRREGRLPEPLVLAFLLAAGLWTKSTMLTLAPLLLVKPAFAAWSRKDMAPMASGLASMAIAFALASPYYARNLVLYGSLLGMESGHGAPNGLFYAPGWRNAYEFLSWTVVTFWNRVNLPLSYHHLGMKLLTIGLTALAAGILLAGWRNRFRRGIELSQAHAVVAASCMLTLIGYVGYNLRFLQADSRLIFHALPAFAVVFTLAFEGLRRNRSQGAGRIHAEPRRSNPVNPRDFVRDRDGKSRGLSA